MPRVRIRPSTYRGKEGFSITGRDFCNRPVKIFTKTRASAEWIKAKVKSGMEITLLDFSYGEAS